MAFFALLMRECRRKRKQESHTSTLLLCWSSGWKMSTATTSPGASLLHSATVQNNHITLGHGYDHSAGAARKAESWKAGSNACVPGEKCWAAAAAPCLQLSRVSPWAEARAPRSAVTTWEHRRAVNDPAVHETKTMWASPHL